MGGLVGENYYVNVTYVGLGAEVTQAISPPERVEKLAEKPRTSPRHSPVAH
jgi:hypothetical protein